MPDTAASVNQGRNVPQNPGRWLIPSVILLMAVGIVLLIAGNWNAWASERPVQGDRRCLRTRGPDAPQHQGSGTGGDVAFPTTSR